MPLELTITAKGQVTLKQAVLDHLGAAPGRKMRVSFLPDGRIELRAADSSAGIETLRGALRRPNQRPVSLAEMQDAIERSADA
ncbi:MAG TPA: AbrB/MazE/SpoVT family DNA-binding domain-containing protein [Acetobacteraceae bacterium]|nr:AbrB/MazE/SpoVT family DNA-binding domain-containing protein [Acetobacteraceae bacterium]